MNHSYLFLAAFLWIFIRTMTNTLAASQPFALLHSLSNPSTNAQADARQGYSVGLDGNVAVVGAPGTDDEILDSGVVNVYEASTGKILHRLTNPDSKWGDNFGFAVAVSGDRIIVTAPHDSLLQAGVRSAYVYNLASSTPTTPAIVLTNPLPTPYGSFGISVAISGTLAAVGAPDRRTVYVYDLAGTKPAVPVVTLTSPGPLTTDDAFGQALGISANRLVVGARTAGTPTRNAGVAYVYNLSSAAPTIPVLVLTNPAPSAHNSFGHSVALSDFHLVVGAPDDAFVGNPGIAYVFNLASAAPTLPEVTLTNPRPAANDHFGTSVAISATRVAVGTLNEYIGGNWVGSAYCYDLTNPTPSIPVATFTDPTPAAHDHFGASLAISGGQVVVGAALDSTQAFQAGSAFVYDVGSPDPNQPRAILNSPSPASFEEFGSAVAISGTRIVVGAPTDDREGLDVGAAYVYDLAANVSNSPVLTLTNPSGFSFDFFGRAVAISGNRVVVSARGSGIGAANGRSGYVYELDSTTPGIPKFILTNSSGVTYDNARASIAISGTRVVIGAPNDNVGAESAGSAHIYDLASQTPTTPILTLTNPHPGSFELFGNAVAISGDRTVIGAVFDGTGAYRAGSAFVYNLDGITQAIPSLIITNPTPGDHEHFGSSVAVHGTRVVIGAPYDDVDESNAGAVYVFDTTSTTPAKPIVRLKSPAPTINEQFGSSVAISGDYIVIGARCNDLLGTDSGTAYVYNLADSNREVPIVVLTTHHQKAYNQFGASVAIDETTIVTGAPNVDSPTVDRGSAYVFGLVPALRIRPVASGLASLTWWPTNSPGFTLQWADSFAPAEWRNAPSGKMNPVTIPVTNGTIFYRLHQQ